ncbi:MAG: carboxypeptidase-like regulatory domain-containing protein, partial [Candidatus Acidiferrales bacterium]
MKRRLISQCVCVAVYCAFAAMSAQAQVPTATINGRVTDPGGAVVNGAIVTATNQTTTVERTTVTNSDGLYLFPDQPVGLYTVTI